MDLGGLFQGVFGILVFVLGVWAIARVINSAASTGKKVLWIAIIILLPILGVIAWYFLGPK